MVFRNRFGLFPAIFVCFRMISDRKMRKTDLKLAFMTNFESIFMPLFVFDLPNKDKY